MKKKSISLIVSMSLVFAGTLRADETPESSSEETSQENVAQVGSGSTESTAAANSQNWHNAAIAVGMIAIAAVAVIIVANHNHS